MSGTGQGAAGSPCRKPRRGDRLIVDVERLDGRGRVVGSGVSCDLPDERTYRVALRRAIPGERVRVEVLKRRGDRVEARVLETLAPSPHASEPRCEHFGTCGGCSFQNLDYALQCEQKRGLVASALADLPIAPDALVPCAEPWAYRNKMEFTFANRRWIEEGEPENAEADFALGLHVPGRWDKVLDVRACAIQSDAANAVLATVRRVARELDLEPWDVREHRGLLRHVVLRRATSTGELMVVLVTSEDAHETVDALAERLLAAHPEITTLVQSVNTRPAAVAIGERERVLHGPGVLREELDGLAFLISPGSFFQTNSRQAEVLFRIVRSEAACTADDVALDVYCGTGSLTLSLARDARHVTGFELVESAVEDARRNAAANGIENVEFVAGDVLETLGAHLDANPAPAVVVVDPPRAGLHPKVAARLASLGARRVVYVSCNPGSAARDLPAFLTAGYTLVRAVPVDLFPHTPHVETVLTLERAEAGA